MNVPGAGNGQPIQTNYAASMPPGLTVDALLTYCQTRLDGLDAQIKQYFTDQQKANADQQALNEAISSFTYHASGITNNDPSANANACNDLRNALQYAINKVGGNTPTGQKLQALMGRIPDPHDSHASPWQVSENEMKSCIDGLKAAQSDITAGSELTMIQLQALNSKRQMAIQLCTNLVASFCEPAAKIVSNIHV